MARQLPPEAEVRIGTRLAHVIQVRLARAGLAAPFWLGAGLLACDPGSDAPEDVCPRARPAFELTIKSHEGTLPRNLGVEVEFGGATSERYSFQRGNEGNDVLCCVPGNEPLSSLHPQTCGRALSESMLADAALDAAPTAPAPLHPPTELRCQIWTNGAADLTITAGETPELRRTLVADLDERYPRCAVWDTTAVKLVLGATDAGVP
jgi:hypothetical protein